MENRDILSTENTEKELSDKAKRDKLRWGIILAFVLVAFILWLIFGFLSKPRKFAPENYSELIENTPKITENQVAFRINDVNISEDIWNYYFMREAEDYAYANNTTVEKIAWDSRDKNSQSVIEKVKYDAAVKLVADMTVNLKAQEWGVSLTDEDREEMIELDVQNQLLGDDAYKKLGIKDEKTYSVIRDYLILKDKVRQEVSLDIKKYIKDINTAELANNKSATIKVIEIPIGEGNVHKENARAKAEEVKERLLKGDNFDTVWKEVARAYIANQDDMETPMVASIYKDSVAKSHKNMEEAALNLQINEISPVIETDYSYMIVQRVEGWTEVLNMLIFDADISINKSIIEKSNLREAESE